MKCYTAIRMSKPEPHTDIDKSQNIMLIKRDQMTKSKYCIVSLYNSVCRPALPRYPSGDYARPNCWLCSEKTVFSH